MNLVVIVNNLPKEQIHKIINTAVQLIKDDPVKFMNAFGNKRKMIDLFATKGVKITAFAIPAAWTGFTMLMTFTFESVLASMQKKAGRLGVMKGLQELDDNRYYADTKTQNEQNKKKESEAQKA